VGELSFDGRSASFIRQLPDFRVPGESRPYLLLPQFDKKVSINSGKSSL
jgi:hypothetical protein